VRSLVTGGNGHVGFNLVQALLAQGGPVRATVRSLTDPTKTAALRALPGVELAEADENEAQMRAAMQGIDTLFHVAAVYSMTEIGRDTEIVDSAVHGADVALRAAAASGVRQVVMTSSVVTPRIRAQYAHHR
jgi:dihydroflavonol-4-reductase